MRKLTLFIIFLLFTSYKMDINVKKQDFNFITNKCFFCNPIDTIFKDKKAIRDTFIVRNIKFQKGIYEIDVSRQLKGENESKIWYWYKIYSVKAKKKEKYEIIKVGEKYELILNPYFEKDLEFDLISDYNREVNINGKKIYTNKKNVYTTLNLKGLYYIPGSVSN
ncbi:MAG: hypothetical protein PHI52_08120 [Bacteroidales bacterium]|nr:hypothetical protein [Bacteroidales bacterium]